MNAKIEPQLTVSTPEGAYPIFIQGGLLAQAGALLSARREAKDLSARCAVVTNPRVGALYAPRVLESLRAAGFDPRLVEMPEGEQYKTLNTARAVYDQLIDAELDRRSTVFALGGGVVGDLAGFVAATFLRGVPFVQLPTTLLAMVDASIGGKVAVDHPRGKNLIGAFKQPLATLADTDTLATLPPEEWRAGMAEVVKHALIGDAELFEWLEVGGWRLEVGGRRLDARRAGGWRLEVRGERLEVGGRKPEAGNQEAMARNCYSILDTQNGHLSFVTRSGHSSFDTRHAKRAFDVRHPSFDIRHSTFIGRAMQVKADIVARDPYEQGERAKLNLGHTFGHTLEKLSGYELRHGDAVAIGLMCAARLALRLEICNENLLARLEKLLGALGLPARAPGAMATEAILDAMTTDKKRVDGRLRFVLPRALGDVSIVDDVARQDVMAAIKETKE